MPASNEYGQDFVNHPSVVAIKQRHPPLWSRMTSFSFSPCNSIVVEQILRDLKTNKSPGYDNITPKLLKFSAKFISSTLYYFQHCDRPMQISIGLEKGSDNPVA